MSPGRSVRIVVKRGLDVIGAAAVLIATAPVAVACAVAVKVSSPGPVLFRQLRAGRGGAPFEILKFRTMWHGVDDAAHREQSTRELAGGGHTGGAVGYKDANDPRITPVGRVLRRFSLDELPQLVNVLRGDMSLVGPRPCPPYEDAAFPEWAACRREVRPGITGLWQVSGRNDLSLLEMLELDCRYVERLSVGTDLSILVRTVPAVLSGAGTA